MSNSFRRKGRRTAACAVLGCAGLLVTGALSGTAAADEPGVPGPVKQPTVAAQRPHFTVPGRTSKKLGSKVAAPRTAAAALAHTSDFDGDGADDLVYKFSSGEVTLDLGDNGYYTAVEPQNSQIQDLLLPGDLTGDGRPDLLTVTSTGSLRVHDGANALSDNGLANFTTVSTGWQKYDKVFTPGDLNGDGRPDLLARSTTGLYFFAGTGKPSAPFGAAVEIGGAGWNQFNQLVGVGDFNGDGIGDVVARNSAGLWLYTGNGAATPAFSAKYQIGGTGWNQYNQVIGGGDYDGNGTHDLLARSYDGTLYFYEGNGNGTFNATRGTVGSPWGDVQQFAGGGANPSFGKDGIYANTPGGTLYYYGGTGTGKLTAKYEVGPGFDRSAIRLYHVSSLTADGNSDLIGKGLYDGHLYNLAEYAEYDDMLAGGSTSYNLVVGPGDLNGDGKGDLIARNSSALYFYAGDGNGLSMKGRVQVGGSGWSQFNTIVGAGDLTGDGKADILARSSAGLFLYAGTGSASAPFGAKKQIGGAGWSQYNKLIAPGDINGDGVADLLARSSNGLYFYAGTGTGTFKARVSIGGAGWSQYADLT
ncbi:putative secreted protein [Actinacidiphila reveromycinica]|uniref:Putative secreted protein n=1 Tax=Actinacidiphila reveromycinica TaxID=659352 RepID=A0A7U3VNA0_9ACTN|nr:VCBS repeat-containing protein [Streptomyces sp. SN-593]BBA97389.1 putative secreted protein [Streptomyces sp. SN-593]